MKTKIEGVNGCSRMIKVELSSDEVNQEFDQVYANIGRFARVPGFRAGHVPRDLLETHYRKKAEEELIKRAIPQYYMKALIEEKLVPVAPPEIDNVQLKNRTLVFRARIDVRPQVKIKAYKNLRVIKKKELAEKEMKVDMEKQILDRLLEKASLDLPQSLLNSQTQQLLNRLKLNRVLQGEAKVDVESKQKELEDEARKEAARRIKLSFILEEIAQLENIQVEENDLEQRIAEIAQAQANMSKEQIRQYLDRENLIPVLRAELRDRKTMEFLVSKAKIEEK